METNSKIHSFLRLRPLALAGAALLLLAITPHRSHAAFTLTLIQVGGNVVVNGNGTINTTSLTEVSNVSVNPSITTYNASLLAGTPDSEISAYDGGGLTGPNSFGVDGYVSASSGTGSLVGVQRQMQGPGQTPAFYLEVPFNYTSGTLLTDSATFAVQTFSSLGFTPGTYTYTWGTGANADSLIVTSVAPEPSTWTLLGLSGAGLAGLTLRRQRRTGLV